MCTESQLKDWMEHPARGSYHLNLIQIVSLLTIAPFVSITSMVLSRESWRTRIWKKPSTVSGTPTDIVDGRGRADCCTGGVGSRVRSRALAGWGRYRCLHGSMPCLFRRTSINIISFFPSLEPVYIDSVCAPFLISCCSDLTANGLWEKDWPVSGRVPVPLW